MTQATPAEAQATETKLSEAQPQPTETELSEARPQPTETELSEAQPTEAQPIEAPPIAATQAVPEQNAVIPIEPPRRQRGSFWKRISARRSVRRAQFLHDQSSSDAVLERLDTIEQRLQGLEAAVEASAERLETRFLQFWEMEEQFGKLRAQVSKLEFSQRDAAERTRRLSRKVTLLAVLALVMASAAIALSLPLGG